MWIKPMILWFTLGTAFGFLVFFSMLMAFSIKKEAMRERFLRERKEREEAENEKRN